MKNNLDDVIHKYDTLQIQYQQKFEEQQINHQFKVISVYYIYIYLYIYIYI